MHFFELVSELGMGILCDMNLSEITLLIGGLAIAMAGVGLARADLLRGVIRGFPRSRHAGWVLAGLCCWLGAREAWQMNMGGLNGYKNFIYVLAPLGVYWQCDVSERVAGGSGIGWVALFDSGSNHEGCGFLRSALFPNYFCVGI